MAEQTHPLIEIHNLEKNFHGLRPLRIKSLTLHAGERIGLSGLDAMAAEVFVNLVTAATLPDRGSLVVFGQPTASILTDTQWLGSLDRFGLVSQRAVLLDGSTVEQNIALPFTLEIDPVPEGTRQQVAALANEVGLDPGSLTTVAGNLSPSSRMRIHLARALALSPSILLLEHPTATVPREEVAGFAASVAAVATSRGVAVLSLSEDRDFTQRLGARALTLAPATGILTDLTAGGWRGWFR